MFSVFKFQGEGGFPPPPVGNDNQAHQFRGGNKVYRSGPLFLSSKVGIGWTTWKKRWFILTRTSLVFFRSDPVSFLSYFKDVYHNL
nr:rho GTPase-activating protein REN1-like [Ipomoea batatas]